MTMPDQPPQGTPEQPQQNPENPPSPSQPYIPPAYPQPSSPYPPPAQPAYPGQMGNEMPPSSPYPPSPQPSYPNQPPSGYPGQPGYPPPSQPAYPGYPPPAWPSTGETIPGQPGYPPSGLYQPGAMPSLAPVPPATKQSNMLGLIIGGGALIVILALLGSLFFLGKGGVGPLAALGATPTPAPTATPVPTDTPVPSPTPSVPAGFSTFTAPDGSYTIAYPSDWSTQTDSSQDIQGEDFLSSDGNSILSVFSLPGIVPTSRYSALLQGILRNATNVKVASKISSVKLGANIWNKQSATFTLQGIDGTASVYGTIHNGKSVVIIDITPTAQLAATDKADFIPMIKSLTFIK